MAVAPIPFTLFQARGVESRVRSLRYDLNAMSDFEQLTGMGVGQMLQTRAVFGATRGLLWAGLRHGDRSLTLDRMGTLMQEFIEAGGDIGELLEACLNAAMDQRAIPDTREKRPEGGNDPNEVSPAPANQSSSQPTGTFGDRG